MPFPFENLKAYTDALAWVEQVNRLTIDPQLRLKKTIWDQLSRAALSVPLNIAEGNGRWHLAEKRQFFWIARGSVFECVAIIQVMKRLTAINNDDYTKCYVILEALSKMLTGLIKFTELSKAGTYG